MTAYGKKTRSYRPVYALCPFVIFTLLLYLNTTRMHSHTSIKILTESKAMQVLKLCKLTNQLRPHYCFRRDFSKCCVLCTSNVHLIVALGLCKGHYETYPYFIYFNRLMCSSWTEAHFSGIKIQSVLADKL